MAEAKSYIAEIRERTVLRPLAESIAKNIEGRHKDVRIVIVGVDAEDPMHNRIYYRIIVASEVITLDIDIPPTD